MAWTYDPSKLETDVVMQVRFKIGDTVETAPMLQDEEITFALSIANQDVIKASYLSVCSILSKESLGALDFTLGPYKESHGARVEALKALKDTYEKQTAFGYPMSNKPTTSDIFWHDMMAISKEEV